MVEQQGILHHQAIYSLVNPKAGNHLKQNQSSYWQSGDGGDDDDGGGDGDGGGDDDLYLTITNLAWLILHWVGMTIT